MVRIFATLAVLVVSNPTASEASLAPVRLTVVAETTVTRSFIAETLAEAGAIWREAGIRIEWQRAAAASDLPDDLIVTLERVGSSPADGVAPLGWIRFADADSPEPHIHLSLANVEQLMDRTAGLHDKPDVMRDVLLSRALGRALAHELGHYLLRSRAHAERGLMRATRPSSDFFAPERNRFALLPDDRRWLAEHLRCAND